MMVLVVYRPPGYTLAGPMLLRCWTIDKSAPENIISLWAKGLRKIGPTRLEGKYKDYTPSRDLQILVVAPLPP